GPLPPQKIELPRGSLVGSIRESAFARDLAAFEYLRNPEWFLAWACRSRSSVAETRHLWDSSSRPCPTRRSPRWLAITHEQFSWHTSLLCMGCSNAVAMNKWHTHKRRKSNTRSALD